jgi:choline kinase
MKAVILAAGRGTRIESVTHGVPKCLLHFGRRTILDHQIESLWSAGVSRIAIVVGHQGQRIVDHVYDTYADAGDLFEFIWNPDFQTTNNIHSLWLARDWVESGDFVCLNADVLFHSAILPPALHLHAPVSMIVDPEWRDETMKVTIRGGYVVRMSKAIPRLEYSATYIGITAFSRPIVPILFDEIESMLAGGQSQQFFNAAVQNLVHRGLHVGFSGTFGLPWAEVDDPEDLKYARLSVLPRLHMDPIHRHQPLARAVA